MEEALRIVMQIAGQGTKMIALIAVILLLNETLKGIGVLHNLITKGRSASNQAAQGPLKDFAKRADLRRDIRAHNGEGVFGGGLRRRRTRRKAVMSALEAEANYQHGAYVAGQAQGNEAFRQQLAGGSRATAGAIQRALATAINTQFSIEAEEVKAANAVIKDLNLSDAQLQSLAKGNDATNEDGDIVARNSQSMQIAAIQRQAQTTVHNINDLLDQAAEGGMDEKARQALAESLGSSGSRPAYVGAAALEGIRQGVSKNARGLAVDALNSGAYASEKIADADKDELHFVANTAATDPGVKSAAKVTVRANARKVIDDPRLRAKIGKSLDRVLDLRDGKNPGPLP